MGAGLRNFVVLVAAIIHLWAVGFHIASIATPYYSSVDDYRTAQAGALEDLTGTSSLTDMSLRGFLYDLRDTSLNYNMFRMCAVRTESGEETEKCRSLLVERGSKHGSKIPDWLRASQAFSIMGCGFAIVSMFLVWYNVVRLLCPCCEATKYWLKLAALLTLIGGVFILIAVIIYAAKYQAVGLIFYKPDSVNQDYEDLSSEVQDKYDDHFELDWGFGLGVTAGCLLCLLSVVDFFAAWLDRSVVKDIGSA